MDKSISVSILMPIYKVEQYLEKTLDSIFTQTYPNIEYVFVNDCSPDNSLQVLKDTIAKYGISKDRFVIVNHLQNEGVARMVGHLSHSTAVGRWVCRHLGNEMGDGHSVHRRECNR